MLSKFGNQSAQKQFIFSNKANFEKGLFIKILSFPYREYIDFVYYLLAFVISQGLDNSKTMINHLLFRPLPGCASPHLQTILANLIAPGKAPPSMPLFIPLKDSDTLCCEVSTPSSWHMTQKTVMMIHGLAGNHTSAYMVRISRKLYHDGYRVIRINLRGCGSGQHLARFTYHGGISDDILRVIQALKQETPLSPLILLGFSLGGNIVLKLAGELGEEGRNLLHHTIAICPSIDLAQSVHLLSRFSNRFYHRYFLTKMKQQASRWPERNKIKSIYDFDHLITAPQWGFQSASDYYQQCSSRFWLPYIQHSCYLLFAADDPFIDYRSVLDMTLSSSVKIWLCQYGGHMGFLGWAGRKHRYFWLDYLLQTWINDI